MTTRKRVFRFVLLFALLAGQWIYAAHSHHDDALGSYQQCQLCLHGVQFDSSLPIDSPESLASAPQQFFITPVRTNLSELHFRFHDPRAPPRS